MLTPLYGFLEGDTIGLLILAHDSDSIEGLATKLLSAARVRVPRISGPKVKFRDRVLDPRLTVTQAGLSPLDRFDVVGERTE